VRLAEAGFAPNEERVVGAGRCFGDGQGRGMGEPVGGADDEGVEGVAAVEAGAAGDGRVDGVRTLGEVVGPGVLSADDHFTVFVTLVGVVGDVVGLGQGVGLRRAVRIREGAFVDVFTGWSDAHAELDLLSEPATERIGDGCAQVAFDLVLNKAARDRQEGKPLHDGEWLDKIQPRPLLRGQRSDQSGAVCGRAVGSELAVELRYDRVPHGGET